MNGLCSRGHVMDGIARRHGMTARRCLTCHRERQRRYNAAKAGPRIDAVTRFWARVDKTDDCWLWTGATGGADLLYGRTKWGHRSVQAHRVAYELAIGPIGQGLQLDHLCRTPLCVNPAHLEPVTNAENVRRGYAARRRVA